ncbi:hypothetical protein GOP47_0026366 [Adiantum capillus-veneris]|nr:hypothetical protein GOP47_0026366 [Adiantum capillus-veneris]
MKGASKLYHDGRELNGADKKGTGKRRRTESQEAALQKRKHSQNDPQNTTKEQQPSVLHLSNTRFDELNLAPLSIKALHSVLKYERMTIVQAATFPVILQGLDVMAKAKTGTGKTIAFLLPAIEQILKESESKLFAVVVCPTRELAQQIVAEANVLLTFHKNLRVQVVIGGTKVHREQAQLRERPFQILVGTPGRLVDHIQNTPDMATLLKTVKLFVLDEADRMLDMGFRDSLDKIMKALPSGRQTLLFSATIPKEVHTIAGNALRSGYEFVDTVGSDNQDTHAEVQQEFILAALEDQFQIVHSVLEKHINVEQQFKVLVFCVTARVTAFMFNLFKRLGFNSREIHSRKSQNQRNQVSEEFRRSKGGIVLFTSDVSARGVDYPDVSLVIQIGAPSDVEQYIHRLGRTGRAGKDGEGLLVLAPWEAYFLKKLENVPIRQLPAPESNADQKNRIRSMSSQVDADIRMLAYQAWIGYYRGLKGPKLSKERLIELANEFSSSMGFKNPPALRKIIVSKMGLLGVQGLNLCK